MVVNLSNMKQTLTKEQHEKLQELGIECVSANDLALLIEMPPKEIGGYSLDISYPLLLKEWSVGYTEHELELFGTISKELIDALFDLVILCIEKGYIKTGKL